LLYGIHGFQWIPTGVTMFGNNKIPDGKGNSKASSDEKKPEVILLKKKEELDEVDRKRRNALVFEYGEEPIQLTRRIPQPGTGTATVLIRDKEGKERYVSERFFKSRDCDVKK
jgi:hypothetical protein